MKPYKISGRGVREPVMNKNTPGVLVAWGAKLKTCTRTNRCFHWHLVELIAEQGFFYERFQLYPSIIVWRSWQSHCWNKRKGKSSSLSLSLLLSHVSAHFPTQFAYDCSLLITPWLNVLEITTKSVHLIKVASPSWFCWLILKETLKFFLFCLFYSSSLLVPCPSRWALCRPNPRTKYSDERTVTMISREPCPIHLLMTGQRWFTRLQSSLGWTVIRWSVMSCVNCTLLDWIALQKRYWKMSANLEQTSLFTS